MATDMDDTLPDTDKIRIVGDFILNAPPGEVREVLNDVRLLLNNDTLLKENVSSVLAQYSKEQLTSVTINGSEHPTLVTEFNDLGGSRFFDPRSKQSFKYDHLREEATDLMSHEPDETAEPWRSALEQTLTTYAKDHYYHGVASVFGSSENGDITLTGCIEDHQFQPKNYWNGRWRSVWTVSFNPSSDKAELSGKIDVQVHYYEDGNVQLVSSKEVKEPIVISNESALAKDFVELVNSAEKDYQVAVSENYQTMSKTTFKALRRALPVTNSKIDWSKIMSYRIGSELKQH
ncbi:F-actin-capping protein subunit alpha [Halotydeus destructor]|nr:F-actin-capping protein subunit alpha [Halotydeus destructor]